MRPILVVVTLTAIFAPPTRADQSMTNIFCTTRSSSGEILTIQLRVPRDRSGTCTIGMANPTIVSGPQPQSFGVPIPGPSEHQGVAGFPTITLVTSSYTTNFTNPAAPFRVNPPNFIPTPPPSPAALQAASTLGKMGLKELGTLTTKQGTACENCQLVTFQKDAVIVLRNDGAYKFLLSDLDETSRQRVKLCR